MEVLTSSFSSSKYAEDLAFRAAGWFVTCILTSATLYKIPKVTTPARVHPSLPSAWNLLSITVHLMTSVKPDQNVRCITR